MSAARISVLDVLREVARDPWQHLVINWNWKSALLSATCRALLFLATNLPVGVASGLRAMAVEFCFRAAASGVFGSLTQAFSRAHHHWIALLALPALGHAAEFVVHSAAGTPRLSSSLAASMAFSLLTTAFNLFAMRRGALIVGAGERSLRDDLRGLPALVREFILLGVRALRRRIRRRRRSSRRGERPGDGPVPAVLS